MADFSSIDVTYTDPLDANPVATNDHIYTVSLGGRLDVTDVTYVDPVNANPVATNIHLFTASYNERPWL